MKTETESQLGLAVKLEDELIDLTIELLILHNETPERLVLNVTREQSLRELQILLQAEFNSADRQSDRIWRLISTALGTAIGYVIETLSGSRHYQLSREMPMQTSIRHSRLLLFLE